MTTEKKLLKGLYDCFYTPRSFPNRRTGARFVSEEPE